LLRSAEGRHCSPYWRRERQRDPDFDNAVSWFYWNSKSISGVCTMADGKAAVAYAESLGLSDRPISPGLQEAQRPRDRGHDRECGQ
jgi:hypothetical protein